jgi:hypothetical protein
MIDPGELWSASNPVIFDADEAVTVIDGFATLQVIDADNKKQVMVLPYNKAGSDLTLMLGLADRAKAAFLKRS